jgi:hypothetical protein
MGNSNRNKNGNPDRDEEIEMIEIANLAKQFEIINTI